MPYTKTIKMEPLSSYCYANETPITAMHSQASVYPTATMDPYTTAHHYANYAPIPNSQYCSVESYQHTLPQTSSPHAYSMMQPGTYIPSGSVGSASPVPSPTDGSCITNPLTPPHEDVLRSSASPPSVHEAGYQTIHPLHTISGTIHLPGEIDKQFILYMLIIHFNKYWFDDLILNFLFFPYRVTCV